jgi:cob(I)alamin adenosyltransferase
MKSNLSVEDADLVDELAAEVGLLYVGRDESITPILRAALEQLRENADKANKLSGVGKHLRIIETQIDKIENAAREIESAVEALSDDT